MARWYKTETTYGALGTPLYRWETFGFAEGQMKYVVLRTSLDEAPPALPAWESPIDVAATFEQELALIVGAPKGDYRKTPEMVAQLRAFWPDKIPEISAALQRSFSTPKEQAS